MAVLHLNFLSRFLQGNTDVALILPEGKFAWDIPAEQYYAEHNAFPVIWLLHGTYGDYTDWIRWTNIERFADQHDFAVVMFSAGNSDYYAWPDAALGYDPYRFLLDELMPLAQQWFPLSTKREENFVAGLSMGGYGACLYGFNNPERFGGVGAFSGVPFDLPNLLKDPSQLPDRMQNHIKATGGLDAYLASPLNVWKKTRDYAEALERGDIEKPMQLYLSCGDKDDLMYEPFKTYKAYLEDLGLEATYEVGEGYAHEWDFWELSFKSMVKAFGLTKS